MPPCFSFALGSLAELALGVPRKTSPTVATVVDSEIVKVSTLREVEEMRSGIAALARELDELQREADLLDGAEGMPMPWVANSFHKPRSMNSKNFSSIFGGETMRATMILPWRLSLSTGVWILSVFVLVLTVVTRIGGSVADQPVREKGRQAVAPGDSVIFNRDMAGAYFIARPLKEQYDSLQKRVTALRTDIREAKIDSAKAHSQIAALQAELKDLLHQIDATKLYIAGSEDQDANRNDNDPDCQERSLVHRMRKRGDPRMGWLRIECVLEKTVFDEDGTNFDNDLAGIKLHARKGTGNEFFGFYKEMAKRTGEKEKALWNGFIFKDYIDQDLSYITVNEGLTLSGG